MFLTVSILFFGVWKTNV